jgi:enoyl-[acyl-carrier protein] reductase I
MDMTGTDRRAWELEGKNVVVLGVADESSIAWGITKAFADHGARVHIGYQQKFFSRVRRLMLENPTIQGDRCDILNDQEITAFFERFRQQPIDVLVHAIAFAPTELFTEYPSNVSLDAFNQSLSISAHSLCKVVRYAKPFLRDWGSVITLTYQASERAEPGYGLMGVAKSALESTVRYLAFELGARKIRVNAVSPGPIETVAALGILSAFLRVPEALDRQRGNIFRNALDKAREEGPFPDEFAQLKAAWKHFQNEVAKKCPLEETVSKEDAAQCALFLGSDYARKITGQVIHVDCGLSTSRSM